jgi:hypothetical protein
MVFKNSLMLLIIKLDGLDGNKHLHVTLFRLRPSDILIEKGCTHAVSFSFIEP